jgi:uncharacterized protein (TIGR03086 family)
MEPIEQLSEILPTVSDLVDRIEPAQLYGPTPCDRFTVHDVLDHMIVLWASFTFMFRGETPPEIDAPAVYGRTPAPEFRKAISELLDAARSEGAMERTIESPMGAMPGETFARLVALDGLVHGYDLSKASGLPFALPPQVVDAVDTFARAALEEDVRNAEGDPFAYPTAALDDATPIERIAAFTGRTV